MEANPRRQAILSGAKTYTSPKPCPKGHPGPRYTSTGGCVACLAIIAASPAKKRYDAAYAAENKDRIRQQRKGYYASLPPGLRIAQAAKWAADNPEKRRAISMNYKAKRRAVESGITGPELLAWKAAQPKVCHWCAVKCEKRYHVDHYVPLSKGGPHMLSNLVIACPKCNLHKSASDPYEFAKTKGRLF